VDRGVWIIFEGGRKAGAMEVIMKGILSVEENRILSIRHTFMDYYKMNIQEMFYSTVCVCYMFEVTDNYSGE